MTMLVNLGVRRGLMRILFVRPGHIIQALSAEGCNRWIVKRIKNLCDDLGWKMRFFPTHGFPILGRGLLDLADEDLGSFSSTSRETFENANSCPVLLATDVEVSLSKLRDQAAGVPFPWHLEENEIVGG